MPYKPVIVDQRLSSSPSSSGRTTPSLNCSPSTSPAYNPGGHRQYGAQNHTATVRNSGTNVVLNHGVKGYQPSSPSPKYGGGYSRHS
ncbi:hypothetical protein ACRE_027440 [Hapsidospora chrysogenum ATCC 11550]|uniref:Uncharacterized protein n=1 Tax=Hapsidospora chrysogenum (strain ATCC 11550 / CBS 779.69 / DSM 880 / IAM 14645 / JCM 23072 / IMI 49137) TaxID=857340 RepID=A0A086TAR2_HAPC1|nr:hypothetical protein ACRE_027440 [Hapsidospora chrysogenum ATCC 11550]